MNTKHILSSTLMGAAILLGSASPIFAQSPTLKPWQERAQERQKNRQEKQELRTERRCDRVNARIDNRINWFNARKDDVVARQKRINERVTEFVNRLEGKGYDVSKVRSDLETLKGMVATFDSDYAVFVGKLEETKQFDCGNSEGAFKQAVEESKAALAKFRADVKASWDFIRNTLRPDLQALRGQKNPTPAASE